MNTIFPQKFRKLLSPLKLPQLAQSLSDRTTKYVTLFGVWLGRRGISIAQWGNRRKGQQKR
jgi:hypothetical protein